MQCNESSTTRSIFSVKQHRDMPCRHILNLIDMPLARDAFQRNPGIIIVLERSQDITAFTSVRYNPVLRYNLPSYNFPIHN